VEFYNLIPHSCSIIENIILYEKKLGILILGAVLGGCMHETSTVAPWNSCFDGLSNQGKTNDKMYVTAGRKAQIIGLQDATFPDLGGHVEGEMGGIWTGSFKLADGYWMKLADVSADEDTLLQANSMTVFPHFNQFHFGKVLDGIKVTSTQFASDCEPGVIISYTIENQSNRKRSINLGFLMNIDLSPVWFSKENGIVDATDQVSWNKRKSLFTAKDSLNDWYMVWGCSNKIMSYETGNGNPHTKGLITPTGIYTDIQLEPQQKETIQYIIASSINGFEEAEKNFQILVNNTNEEINHKKQEIESLLSKSQIEIPDKDIERAYYWTKINNRWLENDVDTIGLFLSAGAVEYPWLFGCDNSYSLQGLLRTGNFEVAKSTLRLLNRVSEKANGNGRIIHEMSNNGFVGNRGNTQETAHYIMALWDAFLWTGDKELLSEIYPNVKQGIAWLTETMDTNRNLFPEGYGIMEVKGLNAELIDVAVYTQQALEAASKMAAIMKEENLSETYQTQAAALKQKINSAFWDEKAHSYCDFYAKASDAIKVAQGAIDQLTMQHEQTTDYNTLVDFYQAIIQEANVLNPNIERGWFTNKNWVINTPMECGIAPIEKAQIALDYIDNNNCGPYGPYLSAVERKHMMTISTGVQAVAEARYGRIDQAINYLRMIASTLGRNMPGTINEMMPDYGCPYQAWTIYGIAKTLVSGCFGVWPEAYTKNIILSPQFPEGWNKMALKQLRINDNSIDLEMERNEQYYIIDYASEQKGWTVKLAMPGMAGKKISVNGKIQMANNDYILIQESDCQIQIPVK